jgi:hypothetical protein
MDGRGEEGGGKEGGSKVKMRGPERPGNAEGMESARNTVAPSALPDRVSSTTKRLVLLVLILAVGAFYVTRHEPTRSYQWQRVESPDGKFAIEFPGAQGSRQDPITSVTGGKFTTYNLSERVGNAAYGCSWWDDPSSIGIPPDQILDRMTERSAVSVSRITVQGHPATDVQTWGPGNAAFDNRIVIVGARTYSLMVVDKTGKRDRKAIEKFFNSFTLH